MRDGVKVAVVGAGDFGRRHIRAIARMPEFDLVAVADRDLDRARAASEEFGGRPFDGLAAALDALDLDAAVIATPPHAHAADLRNAVDAGVPVMVEKPIVATTDELAVLAAMSSEQRALIHPAHISRYLPTFATLRERLVGERIRMIRAVRVVPAERVAMHGDAHPAMAAMVHDLDLVRALVTTDLVAVTSEQAWSATPSLHPTSVVASLRFADGVVVSVDTTWTMPHDRQYIDARLEVFADGFSATLALPGDGLRWADADGIRIPDTELEGEVYGIPTGALANELRSFAAVVSGRGVQRGVTLEEAEWTVRTALRIAAQQVRSG